MYIKQTDSTNRLLRDSLPKEDGFFITTDYQTEGRGQVGNHWESEAGKNILTSILIRPQDLEVGKQFRLSMITSISVVETILQHLSPVASGLSPIAIKWPNDIYYEDCKLGGILIENIVSAGKVSDCIFGLGLNINQGRFTSDAPNPISLLQITGRAENRETILTALRQRLQQKAQLLDDAHYEELKARYISYLYRRDGYHEYEDEGGRFRAVFKDIDEHGRLVLTDEQGRERSYLFKQLKFIHQQ